VEMSIRRVRRTLAGLAVAALLAWGTSGLAQNARAASNAPCQPLPAPAASASASPSSSASASAGASASPDQAPVTLCVTVQRAQASVQAGQAAGFTIRVQAHNGATPDVSVTLTASAGQALITGLCPSGDGAASCQLGPLGTATTPASYTLDAQILTPSAGVAQVTLTAAEAASTAPPMTVPATAAATVTVVPAGTAPSTRPPTPSRSFPAAATTVPATVPIAPPALDPVPSPVAESTTVLAPAGSASSLFPVIAPSQPAAIPPAPGTQSALGLAPQADSASGAGGGTRRLAATSATILGALAFSLAVLLVATRISRRLRRHRHRPVRAVAGGTAATRDGSPGSSEPESQVSHTASSATQAAEPREALPAGGQPHPGEYLG
jgi:hypothetical protein